MDDEKEEVKVDVDGDGDKDVSVSKEDISSVDDNQTEDYGVDNTENVATEQASAVDSEFEVEAVIDDAYVSTTPIDTTNIDTRFGTVDSMFAVHLQKIDALEAEVAQLKTHINFIIADTENVVTATELVSNDDRITNALNKLF